MMMWSALALAATSLILLHGGITTKAAAFLITPSNNKPASLSLVNKGAISRRIVASGTAAGDDGDSGNLLDNLEKLYNDQITREFEASQLYLSASIWCDQRELVGMGAYMRSEANEERGHGLKFIDYAMKRSLPLSLGTVQAPPCSWDTPEELWSDVLNCERRNSVSISNLADAAHSCHDHATAAFLQPFHLEQVDSMDKLSTILAKVQDENQTPGLLRQLDSELGSEAGP